MASRRFGNIFIRFAVVQYPIMVQGPTTLSAIA